MWIGFIVYEVKQNATVLHYWGFRTDNIVVAMIRPLLLFLVASISMLWFGIHFETAIPLNLHFLMTLVLYPLWGTIQQFLIQGLVTRNVALLLASSDSKTLLVTVSGGAAFSIVHFPSIVLMVGTAVLGLFYARYYQEVPNLFILGLFHGWTASLFYFWIMGEDTLELIFK